MKYSTGLVAAALFATAGVANAGVSSTATLVSDYDFRGQSLSASDPALQWSLDYAADSGFYVGAWVSNIDYGSSVGDNIELDLYGGWAGSFGNDMGWDLGLVWYTYPESRSASSATQSFIYDYPEVYASISRGPFKLKQWYTNNYSGTDQDAFYTELNASFELPAGFTLNLHGGYNYGEYWKNNVEELFDYSAGVGYTAGHFNVGLKVTGWDTSSQFKVESDEFNNEPRLVFSVSTTFPWASEEVAAPPPPPPPPPKDTDGDGVVDGSDQCPATPKGDRVGPYGCSCDVTKQLQFASNSAELTDADKASLDETAANLTRLKFMAGTVEGHSDNTGSDAYNQGLSERRAKAVADYLQGKGIAVGRLNAVGFGESQPVADNATREGRAQNRRVVLKRTDCDAPR